MQLVEAVELALVFGHELLELRVRLPELVHRARRRALSLERVQVVERVHEPVAENARQPPVLLYARLPSHLVEVARRRQPVATEIHESGGGGASGRAGHEARSSGHAAIGHRGEDVIQTGDVGHERPLVRLGHVHVCSTMNANCALAVQFNNALKVQHSGAQLQSTVLCCMPVWYPTRKGVLVCLYCRIRDCHRLVQFRGVM